MGGATLKTGKCVVPGEGQAPLFRQSLRSAVPARSETRAEHSGYGIFVEKNLLAGCLFDGLLLLPEEGIIHGAVSATLQNLGFPGGS